MPTVRLFRQRTLIGGDDVQPLAFLTVAGRLFQLWCLSGDETVHHVRVAMHRWFVTAAQTLQNERPELGLWIATTVLFVLVSFILEAAIWYWSNQGYPTEDNRRSVKVGRLLELKVCLNSVPLACTAALGALVASSTGTTWDNALSSLLLSQLGESLLYSLVLWNFFNRSISSSMPSKQRVTVNDHHCHEHSEHVWMCRIAWAYRCLSAATMYLFGGRNVRHYGRSEFGDLARHLADCMETRGVIDIAPSDIVAGLIALWHVQQQKIKCETSLGRSSSQVSMQSLDSQIDPVSVTEQPTRCRDRCNSPPTIQTSIQQRRVVGEFNGACKEEKELLVEVARYAKYAQAVYSLPFYLYMNPCSGPIRLLGGLVRDCFSARWNSTGMANPTQGSDRHESFDDTIVRKLHKRSIVLSLGLNEANLVYAQLDSGLSRTPYCILLDHEQKSVVVSVRGMFSIEDCITAGWMTPISIEQLGEEFGFDATDQYCYRAALASAWDVYNDLQQHGILEKLLLGDKAPYRDFTLRLVGHSLGAASCTLVSFMLRKKFPDLRCINYAPPGCTMTWELATQCQDWCTSCVLDTDVVSRLSVQSIERLRDECLELIGRIKIPKLQLFNQMIVETLCHAMPRQVVGERRTKSNDILFDEGEAPHSDYRSQLSLLKKVHAARRRQRGPTRSVKLYPPGRILHLSRGMSNTCTGTQSTTAMQASGSRFTPRWRFNDDLDEFVLASTMMIDHMPNRIEDALHKAIENVIHC